MLEMHIEERFSEYRRLIQVGAYYHAIANLVQIHHCLPIMSPISRTKWGERLKKVELSDKVISVVESEVKRDVQYIERVLSIGSLWNSDEILLVLQQRILVDMFIDYFHDCIGKELSVHLSNADRLIKAVAQTTENKRSFEIAIRLMKRNWGLPIRSQWLDELLIMRT